MADGITIRITGDDSDFMRTLASLEEQTRATLESLTAAASLAGTALGTALDAAGGFDLSGGGEELARQAARLAETVARAWSGASALEAPSIALSGALPNVGALLEGALASMQADFSAAAETLRAALNDGYLRPGFEGVDWEGLAARLSERLSLTGAAGAQALAATAPALSQAGEAAMAGVPAALDVSAAAATAGRSSASGWTAGFNSRVDSMRAAARAAARSVTSAFNGALGIASPSKVFQRSGHFTGEGFILGYEESIREAQRAVRGLTDGLVSAAALPAQSAMSAAQSAQAGGMAEDELSRLNVGLYISDRKIAEATADAGARVSNARSKRLAAGWGHV